MGASWVQGGEVRVAGGGVGEELSVAEELDCIVHLLKDGRVVRS